MNFEESLQYLLSLGHETLAIKLGLRNTELLLEKLDHPERAFPSVQIAGTNGKGSTAVLLDSICRAAGISTGVFTSPHLVSITERIRVEGREISEEDFARFASEVRSAADSLVAAGTLAALPTFFEQVTAIALMAFSQAKVKLAILETGLGGRLDATTVAGAAIIAITPLALDHQEYLGETLSEIAAEKAAIIRPGVTAIIAAQPAPALEVILRHCAEAGVEPSLDQDQSRSSIEGVTNDGRLVVTFETDEALYEKVRIGLRGRHQIVNTSVAIRLAESLRRLGFAVSQDAIIEGTEAARHAGRLELVDGQPSWLFDGAHNPAGAQALRDYLDEFVKQPITVVFGAMNDKRLEEMAAILFPVADRLIVTQPDSVRAANVDRLQDLAGPIVGPENVTAARSVREALRLARSLTPANGLICVTGSLYLLGEVRAIMQKSGDLKSEI
ncbi:MAG TPA: folylpolyglutamate synthase/dihydrofolate synthase family protein [Pyrinomonadaceae bacterium]|nr:folylpolyglutamate synthase/dihydrofolate synthase family protein [Pyrinomonadaceae bacterium]